MHACMHACKHPYIYTHTHLRTYIYMYVIYHRSKCYVLYLKGPNKTLNYLALALEPYTPTLPIHRT